MTQKKSLSLYWIFIFILVSAGVTAFFIATSQWGIGTTEDGASYISGARSILNGTGYRNYRNLPLTTWPPLFSSSLAFLGIVGFDLLEGARLMNIFLFGFNALIAGLILKKITGSSKIAFVGTFFMLTSNAMFRAHAMALSEPL